MGGSYSYESAVQKSIDILGTGVLSVPSRFLGSLMDLCDPDSPELMVLERNCDSKLLNPFAEASTTKNPDDLEVAHARVYVLLTEERFIDAKVALSICDGITKALQKKMIGDKEGRIASHGNRAVDVGANAKNNQSSVRKGLGKNDSHAQNGRYQFDAKDVLKKNGDSSKAEVGNVVPQNRGLSLVAKLAIPAVMIAIIAGLCLVFASTTTSKTNTMEETDSVEIDAGGADEEPGIDVNSIEDDVDASDGESGIDACSWKELKTFSQKIAAADEDEWLDIAKEANLVDEKGRLQGDTKSFLLNDGAAAEVRIVGFRHDELADGGVAGITFEFANVPAQHRMNAEQTNAGGWERSEMREWLNSDFLAMLPEDLRGSIAKAKKLTNNTGKVDSEDGVSVFTPTTDKLWLLSISEVYGGLVEQPENTPLSSATYDAEGVQYQFYAHRGYSITSHGSSAKSGATWRWLRSPYAFDAVTFRCVIDDWDRGWGGANCELGVSPGFCF